MMAGIKYTIVFHLFAPDGRKRIGGVNSLRTDEIITTKNHPAFLARITEHLKKDIQPGDRISIYAVHRYLDEGNIPWIPPTTQQLEDK